MGISVQRNTSNAPCARSPGKPARATRISFTKVALVALFTLGMLVSGQTIQNKPCQLPDALAGRAQPVDWSALKAEMAAAAQPVATMRTPIKGDNIPSPLDAHLNSPPPPPKRKK